MNFASRNLRSDKEISLLDAFFLWIVVVSVVSVSLLVVNMFHSVNALLISSILFLGLCICFKFAINLNIKKMDSGLLLILLIAFFFRSEPYLNISGGEDAGIYVNMSSSYEKNGSTFIDDKVRKNITDLELKKYYDDYNLSNSHYLVKQNEFEGIFLPGIYIKNVEQSKYVYQFYPLHPLWMAISAKILGEDNRVYSLVFFSLVSIVAFFFLAFELSGGRRLPAYLIAFILAIQPIHGVLSKYPVSEIVSLAFSSGSLYYLIKYYNGTLNGRIRPFHLLLSAGLVFCFFFTRISGFIYIPFYYILLLITFFFVKDTVMRKQLFIYFISIFALFSVSVLYGLYFSFPYFHDIYLASFEPFLGSNWILTIFLILFFMTFSFLILVFFKEHRFVEFIRERLMYVNKVLIYAFVLIIFLSLYKAYEIGFTHKYGDIPWGALFKTGLGWKSLTISSLFAIIINLSPFGFILFPFSLNYVQKRKKNDVVYTGLVIFLIVFWCYGALLQYIAPWWYAMRYQMSELLPYTLLLISLYVGYLYHKNETARVAVYVLILFMSIYFISISLFQFRGTQCEGADAALKKVARQLDEKDILLLNRDNFGLYTEIKTPLFFYYNLNVFDFKNEEDLNQIARTLVTERQFKDLFVLSQTPLSQNNLLKIGTILYKRGKFNCLPMPILFSYASVDLYLYKMKNVDDVNFTKTIRIEGSQFERENFYEDRMWTNGYGVIKGIDYKITPLDKYLVIATNGSNPFRNNLEKLKLRIFVNGAELRFVRQEGVSYCFELDRSIKEINEIRIQSSTFIPKQFGINNDDRTLGIDLVSISISGIDSNNLGGRWPIK